jgi:hypothetical protein
MASSRMGRTCEATMSHLGATSAPVPAWRSAPNSPSRSPSPARSTTPLEQAAENTARGAAGKCWQSRQLSRWARPNAPAVATACAGGSAPACVSISPTSAFSGSTKPWHSSLTTSHLPISSRSAAWSHAAPVTVTQVSPFEAAYESVRAADSVSAPRTSADSRKRGTSATANRAGRAGGGRRTSVSSSVQPEAYELVQASAPPTAACHGSPASSSCSMKTTWSPSDSTAARRSLSHCSSWRQGSKSKGSPTRFICQLARRVRSRSARPGMYTSGASSHTVSTAPRALTAVSRQPIPWP